jgi:hypothetical protein
MLVFFSARRLKPGAFDQFRQAWQPEGDDDLPPETVAIYHAQNLKDPDEVISFGIFDVDDKDRVGGDEQAELARQDRMAAFVKNIPLEGVYKVVEVLNP